MVKLGSVAAIAREARGLAQVAGLGVAPTVIAHGAGTLVTEWLPGVSPSLADISPVQAAAVGGMLALVHAQVSAPAGGYDGWEAPVSGLREYRHRRARDIAGRAGGSPAPAARPAPGDGPPAAGQPTGAGGPFHLVHGDVWGGNILWRHGRPRLVDWEHHRVGDPAEDLAYAAAMDDVPQPLMRALLDGYGAPRLAAAVRWWRPLLALDCAAWFSEEGDPARARTLRAQAARLLDTEEPPER